MTATVGGLTALGDTAARQLANATKTVPQLATITHKAAGGPVSASKPYLVGEQGPELFIPSASGGIVPHGALTAARTHGSHKGGDIYLTITGPIMGADVEDTVMNAMQNITKRNGSVPGVRVSA